MSVDDEVSPSCEAIWASTVGLVSISIGTAEDGRSVVALMGELDVVSATEVRAHLATAIATGRDLVVDLSELRFIDSTGMTELVIAEKVAKQAGLAMSLRSPRANVMRALHLGGIDTLFEFEE